MSIDEWKLASLASWNANARFWDNYIGSGGNDFVQLLEMPALERLAGLRPGEYVLDLATGNGLVARRMAELGGIVTGTDASSAMLECAEARTAQGDHHRGVTYQILDVTNWEDLEAFVSSSTSQQTENVHEISPFPSIIHKTLPCSLLDLATPSLRSDYDEYGYHGYRFCGAAGGSVASPAELERPVKKHRPESPSVFYLLFGYLMLPFI